MKKKGLSDIVTTLIIILLALVAIGVIWVVASSILDKGKDQIELNQNCMGINFELVDAVCSNNLCNITIERNAQSTYSGNISGLKVVFLNVSNNARGSVIDLPGNIAVLDNKRYTNLNPGVSTPKGIEIAVYFKTGERDSEYICGQTITKWYD